ncbi:hypothetical protein LIA77_01578 [Sarocladium implicatum]|nr:hypothetical protein LIA77_01578 [Sarocladium implicatum]
MISNKIFKLAYKVPHGHVLCDTMMGHSCCQATVPRLAGWWWRCSPTGTNGYTAVFNLSSDLAESTYLPWEDLPSWFGQPWSWVWKNQDEQIARCLLKRSAYGVQQGAMVRALITAEEVVPRPLIGRNVWSDVGRHGFHLMLMDGWRAIIQAPILYYFRQPEDGADA